MNLLKYKKSLLCATIGTTAIITKPSNNDLVIEMVKHVPLNHRMLLFGFMPSLTTYRDYLFLQQLFI